MISVNAVNDPPQAANRFALLAETHVMHVSDMDGKQLVEYHRRFTGFRIHHIVHVSFGHIPEHEQQLIPLCIALNDLYCLW